MTKTKYMQFRVDSQLKQDFKMMVRDRNMSMSEVLTSALQGCVDDINAENTQLCMLDSTTNNKPNVFFHIKDFDDSPELKKLLIEYEYGMNEEHHCVTDDCLLGLYCQLLQNNQLHMLFEWNAFNNSIINGFNDNDDTEVGVIT